MPRAGEDPKVRKGEPDVIPGDQLPEGEVAAVNQGLDDAEALQAETDAAAPTPEIAKDEVRAQDIVEDTSAPEGVQFDEGGGEPRKLVGDEDTQFLYGPTQRPDEPITAGSRAHKAPPPEDLMTWLPYLVEFASQPDSPQEVKQFVQEIMYNLARG